MLHILLFLCISSAVAFEYEKDDGWYAATQNTRVELIDIKSIVIHAKDRAINHEGKTRSAMKCVDGIRGLSDWFADTPTCNNFMQEYSCIQCQSTSKKCCSLDLTCTPCIEHLNIHIEQPRLVCEPYNGITIRAVDPSSCVLQFEISQDRKMLGMEIGIIVWLFIYNTIMFLIVNTLHRSCLVRCREFGIALICSCSIIFVFAVYVYFHIWYVYTPLYVAYAALCSLPVIRMFFYRKKAKTKKEMV